MKGSIDRVRKIIRGETPDRPPLYDLLRNDSVLSHFAGEKLSLDNAREVVFRAYGPAIDATRPMVRLPQEERTEHSVDGRAQKLYRWTTWTERVQYETLEHYAEAKNQELENYDDTWNQEQQKRLDIYLTEIEEHRRKLGDVFFFPSGKGLKLMGLINEIGLEDFSYCLVDYPELIDDLLEMNKLKTLNWIRHLPDAYGIEAVFCGDDIAFKSGPFFSPEWFREHYFPRFAAICDAYHRKGIKVLFHSDGNLNSILDGLVEAGIDGLNPIEVLAGMDVGDIHRRFPKLFMAGGIDVSQLLPFGMPGEIRLQVKKTIDAAEGRIMIGSTTELNNEVPLENFLAMREAVLNY